MDPLPRAEWPQACSCLGPRFVLDYLDLAPFLKTREVDLYGRHQRPSRSPAPSWAGHVATRGAWREEEGCEPYWFQGVGYMSAVMLWLPMGRSHLCRYTSHMLLTSSLLSAPWAAISSLLAHPWSTALSLCALFFTFKLSPGNLALLTEFLSGLNTCVPTTHIKKP